MAHVIDSLGEALLVAHQQLLEALTDLRALVDHGGQDEVTENLPARLASTRKRLVEHFDLEEQNGYTTAVEDVQPHLMKAAQRLHEDHDHLLTHLDQVRAAVQSGAEVTDDIRERVRVWLNAVRRHEQAENLLLQDAFGLDIATGD